MKIGIVGAGNIGSALTRRFTAVGHEVSVANSRGPETLADLAAETGARAVTAAEAANGADVVVITIPTHVVPSLPDDLLAGASPDVVVIDTNNYYPRQRDGRIEAIENGETESRWVGEQLGHPVVKAFNNIVASHLESLFRPAGAVDRIALPVAGDDADARAVVMGLIDEIGYDPVDAGTIDESWRQQPGSPIYAVDPDAARAREMLAAARPEREAAFSG